MQVFRGLLARVSDLVAATRARRRLRRQIAHADARMAVTRPRGRSAVLLGASRLGKTSIAKLLDEGRILLHIDFDLYLDYLDTLTSQRRRTALAREIVAALLGRFPRGMVLEGAGLNALFLPPDAECGPAPVVRVPAGIRCFAVVAPDDPHALRASILRGRSMGACWSVGQITDDDLPILVDCIAAENARLSAARTPIPLQPIHVDLTSHSAHLHSIRAGAALIAQRCGNGPDAGSQPRRSFLRQASRVARAVTSRRTAIP